MIDYEFIKDEAKRRGVMVADLLALSADRDPYYCGTPGQVAAAEWFTKVFEMIGADVVHIRRVHYFAVSDPSVPPKSEARGHEAETYINTDRCYKWIGEVAAQAARYLGYIPYDAIEDRRNPPAVFAETIEAEDPVLEIDYRDLPEFEPRGMPRLPEMTVCEPTIPQPYRLVIVCEKSTMNDVLTPLAEELGADLVTGLGELSITRCYQAVERAVADGRPCRILYISDHDPAGEGMPASFARKIQFLMEDRELDIGLHPILLTGEQADEYDLPRVPGKGSDKRLASFEERNGDGIVELDALEALHPGELERIVRDAAAPYIDAELQERIDEAQAEAEQEAQTITDEVHEAHADAIKAAQDEWEEIQRRHLAELQAWRTRHAPAWQRVADDLDARSAEVDLDNYPEPEVDGDVEELLYHSDRDYFEQTEILRAQKGKA